MILIIGSNSKIIKLIGTFCNADLVSHSNIPLNGDYKSAYIFSYSSDKKENKSLLDKVHNLNIANTVYISSITAGIHERYHFKYPAIKRYCEILAAERGFNIVRIGLIVETMKHVPKYGTFAITEINEIVNMINNNESSCKDPEIKFFGGKITKLFEKIYLKVLILLGPFSFLMRPLDLILKIIGHSWYGYNSIAVHMMKEKNK